MTFDDLTKEYYNSMTLGYPRRLSEQCRCGAMHSTVIRHAGYGVQKWFEVDGVLLKDAPCKQAATLDPVTRAAIVRRCITNTPHPAVTDSRYIRERDKEWAVDLPEPEQEYDETVAYFLQMTGRM